jgi:hypothetical protein
MRSGVVVLHVSVVGGKTSLVVALAVATLPGVYFYLFFSFKKIKTFQ